MTDYLQNYIKTCIARTDYYWEYTDGVPYCKHKKLERETIQKLIDGKIILGLSPIIDKENVLFGAIDFDVHSSSKPEQKLFEKINDKILTSICKELDKLKYLYFVNSSGSKGKHLRVYNRGPINAKIMRYFLIDLYKKCSNQIPQEVFPKQERLDDKTPYGNQIKAVLAIHPKTKQRANIIQDGKILSLEQSLIFLADFSEKMDKANSIGFEITEKMEKEYGKSFDFDNIEEQPVPKYCEFIEGVACQQELTSGKATRHDYLDANVAVYCTNNQKPEIMDSYMVIQNRNSTAFNGFENWKFSCDTIRKYCKMNDLKDCICSKYQKTKKKEQIKPQIEIPRIGISYTRFIISLGDILKNKDIFYKPDIDSVVSPMKIDYTDANNNHVKVFGLKEMNSARMITYVEKICMPVVTKLVKRKGVEFFSVEEKSLNESQTRVILKSDYIKQTIRPITKVLNCPIPFIKDNYLCLPKRGYNHDLGLFVGYSSPQIENLDMDINEAKKILFNIFEEFCFKNDSDIGKAVLAFLTPFCRGLYKEWGTLTPIFIYIANTPRAGKDCCAKTRLNLYEGQAVVDPPISTDDKNNNNNEEWGKRIFAKLRNAERFLHSENNKGRINSAVLEQISTCHKYSGRILGKSEQKEVENHMEISLSANIPFTLTQDLSNRSIQINLHFAGEDPTQRVFKKDLEEYIRNNREKILAALYALVKNWFKKGSPKSTAVFTSYPEWASVCGGILEANDIINPLHNRIVDFENNFITTDSETQEIKKLFELIYNKKPDQWIKKKAIKKIIRQKETVDIENKNDNLLVEDLEDYIDYPFGYLDLDEKSDYIKFGQILKKYIDREFSEITMIEDKSIKTGSYRPLMFTKKKTKTSLLFDDILGMKKL